jgi:hypothetical protein
LCDARLLTQDPGASVLPDRDFVQMRKAIKSKFKSSVAGVLQFCGERSQSGTS